MTGLGSSFALGAAITIAAVSACALVVPPLPKLPPEEVEERTPPKDGPPALRIVPAKDGGLTCFTPRDLARIRERLERCDCPEEP